MSYDQLHLFLPQRSYWCHTVAQKYWREGIVSSNNLCSVEIITHLHGNLNKVFHIVIVYEWTPRHETPFALVTISNHSIVVVVSHQYIVRLFFPSIIIDNQLGWMLDVSRKGNTTCHRTTTTLILDVVTDSNDIVKEEFARRSSFVARYKVWVWHDGNVIPQADIKVDVKVLHLQRRNKE